MIHSHHRTTSTMTTLILLLLATIAAVNGKTTKKSTKYEYKEGSNQAYVSSSWIGTNCIDFSTFSTFATDYSIKETDSEDVFFTIVNGNGRFFTNCNDQGATLIEVSFFTNEALTKLIFTTKKGATNATVVDTVNASHSRTTCTVVEIEVLDENGEIDIAKSYVCDETTTVTSVKPVFVDTFLRHLPTGDVYTDKSTDTSTGPGFIEKFKSESTCRDTTVTRKIVRVNNVRINIPSGSTYGSICKTKNGYVERITFV